MKHFNEEHNTPEAIENQIQKIPLSTGNVNRKYLVRDIIFATDRVEIDLFSGHTDANKVFAGVKRQLRKIAYDYEADAVINCVFQQQLVDYEGKKVVEIFSYGTVIQFNQTTIG